MDLLARLAEDPLRAAVLLDVDGVLAPIVPKPEDARVPEETQAELRRLLARYALVACISGRTGAEAERIVGVPGLVYVGNHGLELEPEAKEWVDRLQHFLLDVDWPRTENKKLSASLHYRDEQDEEAARGALEVVRERAEALGLVARFGRKVLELLPPHEANKGTAVQHLLSERGLRRALYAGDDRTDIDAFRALDGLEVSVRVGIASPEGPPELLEQADVVIDSPGAFLNLLRRL